MFTNSQLVVYVLLGCFTYPYVPLLQLACPYDKCDLPLDLFGLGMTELQHVRNNKPYLIGGFGYINQLMLLGSIKNQNVIKTIKWFISPS